MMAPPLRHDWQIVPGVLRCGTGSQRLGGVFDVFFESYWARFTPLRDVQWRGVVQGHARLTLWRRDARDGAETELASWCGGGGQVTLTADFADGGESSLHIEVSDGEGATLSDAGWFAPRLPPRHVHLGLAMTTYHREDFVRANLARLADQMAGAELLIVNHGKPGLAQRLADAIPPGMPVWIIDQDNSGGAGGATRAMRDYADSDDVTHMLLMDDDIDLPGDLVLRVGAVLAWADGPLCVGGAMFDHMHRTQLFSAGDSLRPGTFAIDHVVPPGGCDVSALAGVDFLARIHAPDFNGWWCFAFPMEAPRTVGVPMPCFIRGDDVEFGLRLKRAGWPTIGWPGIAVWHLSFAGKSAPWQMFYDRRNSLFANAIHHRVSRGEALRVLLGGFIHHVLRYDYDRVRAMTMGIAAFNRGAAAMTAWTAHDHAALLRETRCYGDAAAKALAGLGTIDAVAPQRLRGWRRSLAMAGRLLADMVWTHRARVAVQLPPGVEWRPDYESRPALVITQSPDGQRDAVFAHNIGATWRALARCAWAITGMLWRFRQNTSAQNGADPDFAG